MQVAVENLAGLERKIKVTIPAADIDQKTTEKLNQLQAKVKLPGFRPGKVPFEVVKQRFGSSARQEILADLIQSSYFEALSKESLQPAGQPHIEPKGSKFGEPLEYSATFEVYPEIKLVELNGTKLEKLAAQVTDKDVENMVEKLRKQHTEWLEADKAAATGDQLLIDFTGKIKGEVFKGGEGKDFKFELGSGSMLEDFEQPLLGAKAGDDINFKLKFPKDYSDESVAGKKAEFNVKLHKVSAAKLPELNDEFLQKLGVKEGGKEELYKQMRSNMERQLEQTLQSRFKNSVLDKLVELNSIDLPKALVDNEINHLQQQAKQQFAQYTGGDVSKLPDLPVTEFEDNARRRVQLGLLMAEVIKQHELKADPEQVKAKIKELAAGYEKPEEVVTWYYQNKQHLAEIESVVLEAEVMAKLQDQITVSDKTVSYEEAMKQDA